MIQLRPDCLIFKLPNGDSIPCSAETVTIELIGEGNALNPETIREAASAVVYYFTNDLSQTFVTVAEFSEVLSRVLTNLGHTVVTESGVRLPSGEPPTNLEGLLGEVGSGFELGFYAELRREFHKIVEAGPSIVRFAGLRETVKALTGAKRWCARCDRVSDQIVDYLRECLSAEMPGGNTQLIVS